MDPWRTEVDNKEFAQQLRGGTRFLGSWCTFASFASAEVVTRLGLDFVILDLQYCELTMTQFPSILSAFRGEKLVPVVRVAQVDYHAINWLFDQGAPAIMALMVELGPNRAASDRRSKVPVN